MGRVFSYDEIVGGHVPTPLDFKNATAFISGELSMLVDSGELIGGLFYGSVAKGTPNPRSDIDLIVITRDHAIPYHLAEMARDARIEFDVPLEVEAIPQDLAAIGSHTIDAGFFHHLQDCAREDTIIGQDPRTILRIRRETQSEIHTDYIDAKLRRLREGFFTASPAEQRKILQRALEAPIAIGRRTLIAMGIPLIDDAGRPDDGKHNVEKLFQYYFKETPVFDGFKQGLQNDRDYSKLVMDTILGNVTRHEYDRQVEGDGMTTKIQDALKWTSEMSIMYRNFLERNAFTSEGQRPLSKEMF